jgi:hypothetical protein
MKTYIQITGYEENVGHTPILYGWYLVESFNDTIETE